MMTEAETSFSIRDFLREITLAWQRFALYPPGHPAQNELVDRAHNILLALVAPTGSVALGVQKDSLIHDGETLDGQNASRLSESLFMRSVAIVRFEEGVTTEELKSLLNLLPRKIVTEKEVPLWDQLVSLGVEHIQFEPVDFTGVVVEGSEEQLFEKSKKEDSNHWRVLLGRLMGDEVIKGHGLGLAHTGQTSLDDILGLIQNFLHRTDSVGSDGGLVSPSSQSSKALSHLSGLLGTEISLQVQQASSPTARAAAAKHIAELIMAIPQGMHQEVLDSALTTLAQEEDSASILSLSDSYSASRVVASLRRLRDQNVPPFLLNPKPATGSYIHNANPDFRINSRRRGSTYCGS